MPIAAAIGAAVVSAGVGIYSANKAADASKTASNNALGYQQQIRGDVKPYLDAGTAALRDLQSPNAFMASPGYQFRLSQGLNAVGTNKAVSGLLRSGGALKAVNDYAQNTASNEFGNWWNQKMGIVNAGLGAEGSAAGVANNSSNIALTNGSNQGNAAIATGNLVNSGLGSIEDLLSRYQTTNTNASSYSGAVH